MNTELRSFLTQLMGVVTMTLFVVAFVAFVSMPLSLNRHPGDARPDQAAQVQHMS